MYHVSHSAVKNGVSFPTILLAEDDGELRDCLLQDLRHEGYFVLLAQGGPEAIGVARLHSRPIQLMLTAESVDGRALAATLKQYRPKMQVLFVSRFPAKRTQDSLTADTVLAKVRELLRPPRDHTLETPQNRKLPARAASAGA
ncbi:hypothetical protein SBA3_1040026 [Candidatus Sulfopaludibacter sp. SbA3]|nr:hypothetical protein SBA3_1040026 [Candidatus Sulfopaludibacter sp. SbA3]